jgi:CHAD domain-containing protein
MAEGKWITGLTPEMPADEAARVVLSVRLSAVRHHLSPAVERAAEDTEHVHQLRVATRRAGAVLRIFRDFLTKKDRGDAKRALRAVRQAAGEARNWDVFLERLAASPALRAAGRKPATDFLAGYALGFRAAAQDVLVAAAAEQSAAVQALCSDLPAAVHRPKSTDAPLTLDGHGRVVLGELFAHFCAEVDAGPASPTELHQLRITGKRLRYAIEVFAGCYPPPLKEAVYPAVERAQEVLGAVQDGHVAAERLEHVAARVRSLRPALAGRVGPGLTALTEEVRNGVTEHEQAFRDWAEEWRRMTTALPTADLLGPMVA